MKIRLLSLLAATVLLAHPGANTACALPNFHRIDVDAYRGGRPGEDDLFFLRRIGVRSVVSLENDMRKVAEERRIVERLGMRFISAPLSGKFRTEEESVEAALAALADPSLRPIFVHCKHGRDRTGLVAGLYRVEAQGWAPDMAYEDEMLGRGFRPILLSLTRYFWNRVENGRE